jgi:tRNA A37 threonylcarbamoyladenosine dehydratase
MDMKYARLQPLLGEHFSSLQELRVLLLGVGGVGSFCLDCLYRSGVENITIVDYDSFDVTNQNRQMWSELHINTPKVEALQQHYPNIKTINEKITPQWVEQFDFSHYDIVLDAIDDREAKIALAFKVHKKLISSFGSAKRLDPTKIEAGSIWQTKGDRFGAKIRYELKKRGFNKKYTVIYSTEEAKCKEQGSFMGVTAAFGLTMCSQTILKILRSSK